MLKLKHWWRLNMLKTVDAFPRECPVTLEQVLGQ